MLISIAIPSTKVFNIPLGGNCLLEMWKNVEYDSTRNQAAHIVKHMLWVALISADTKNANLNISQIHSLLSIFIVIILDQTTTFSHWDYGEHLLRVKRNQSQSKNCLISFVASYWLSDKVLTCPRRPHSVLTMLVSLFLAHDSFFFNPLCVISQ